MADERIDIYDITEKHIKTAMKSVAHRDKLWHKSFHCWITWVDENGKTCILFQLRSHQKEQQPGKLDISAAGHLQAGEQISDGVREITEELGINVTADSLIELGKQIRYASTEFSYAYLLKYEDSLTHFKLQKTELDGLFYVPIDDFLNLVQNRVCQIQIKEYQTHAPKTVSMENFAPHQGNYYYRIMNTIKQACT